MLTQLGVIVAVAVLALAGIAAGFIVWRLRHPRFSEVVETARPGMGPRIGFKVESMFAHPAQPATPPAAAVPIIPFAMFATAPEAEKPADGAFVIPPVNQNKFRTTYAASVVQGSVIRLPSDADVDIEFRSVHNTGAVAQAGDRRETIRPITNADGQISLREDGDIEFGPGVD